jgi:hypothetical protein
MNLVLKLMLSFLSFSSVSGFFLQYTYNTWVHGKGQDAVGVGQARTSIRFKDVFDYTYLTETLNGTHPSASDLAKSVSL